MVRESRALTLGLIETELLDGIDGLPEHERLEGIKDLIHRLNFELRLRSLTQEELAHMHGGQPSPEARERLGRAKTKKELNELIAMYARADYFRRCAWISYLNEGGEKPFTSHPVIEKKVA